MESNDSPEIPDRGGEKQQWNIAKEGTSLSDLERYGSSPSFSDCEPATAVCSLTCTAWKSLTPPIIHVEREPEIPNIPGRPALSMHLKEYACGRPGLT